MMCRNRGFKLGNGSRRTEKAYLLLIMFKDFNMPRCLTLLASDFLVRVKTSEGKKGGGQVTHIIN